MGNKRLRVGIVGAGPFVEKRHLPGWKELEEEGRVKLVALCRRNKKLLEETAARFDVKKTYMETRLM